jgi:hypothetical protein
MGWFPIVINVPERTNVGKGINDWLHAFNAWFDTFILEAAKPLAVAGFVMGTVDIFTRGGIATNAIFATAWSIVQALVIDGLFFAVWWRFFGGFRDWDWRDVGRYISQFVLLLIGVLLSVVAMLTNMIIGFQQLWGIADSQQAMTQLGVDPVRFVVARSILVVLVTIMVSFTYYTSGDVQYERKHTEPDTEPDEVPRSYAASILGSRQVPLTVTQVPSSQEEEGVPLLLPAGDTRRNQIKQVWYQRLQEGLPTDQKSIADAAGIPLSTVKKYSKSIRLELGV